MIQHQLRDPFPILERDQNEHLVFCPDILQNIFPDPNSEITIITLIGEEKLRRLVYNQIMPKSEIDDNNQDVTQDQNNLRDEHDPSKFVSITPFRLECPGDKLMDILVLEISKGHLDDEDFAKLIDICVFASSVTLHVVGKEVQDLKIQWSPRHSFVTNLSKNWETNYIVVQKKGQNLDKDSTKSKIIPAAALIQKIDWSESLQSLLGTSDILPHLKTLLITKLEVEKLPKFGFGLLTENRKKVFGRCAAAFQSYINVPLSLADFEKIFYHGLTSINQASSRRKIAVNFSPAKKLTDCPPLSPPADDSTTTEKLNSIKEEEDDDMVIITLDDDPTVDNAVVIDIGIDALKLEEEKNEESSLEPKNLDSSPVNNGQEKTCPFPPSVKKNEESQLDTENKLLNSFVSKYKIELAEKIQSISLDSNEFITDDQIKEDHDVIMIDIINLWSRESHQIPYEGRSQFVEKLSHKIDSILESFLVENGLKCKILGDLYRHIWCKIAPQVECQIKEKIDNFHIYPEQINLIGFEPFMYEQFKSLPRQIQSTYFRWFQKQLDIYLCEANRIFLAMKYYTEQMKTSLNQLICLSRENFRDCHAHIWFLTLQNFPSPSPKPDNRDLLFDRGIENVQKFWAEQNDGVYQAEETLASSAVDYALKEYGEFMKMAVLENFLTDQQLQNFHLELVTEIGNCFMAVFNNKMDPLPSTRPWEIELNILKRKLDQQFIQLHVEENRKRLAKLKTRRKIAGKIGEEIYRETLRETFLDPINEKKLRKKSFLHKAALAAEKIARKMFNEEAKDVPPLLRSAWWESLRGGKFVQIQDWLFREICTLKNILLDELEDDSLEEEKTIKNEDLTSQNGNDDFGVSIYFGPDIVRIGVYRHGFLTLPPFLAVTRPLLAFTGTKILFDEDAEGMPSTKIDLYKALLDLTRDPILKLEIGGNLYQLRTEELLAIFLNRIKTNLENYLMTSSQMRNNLNSCVMVVSSSLPMISRLRLKNAVKLAGFQNSTLIHAVTAIGLSYIFASQNNIDDRHPVLMVHKMTGGMDVALGHVTKDSLIVKAVWSLAGRVNHENIERNIQQILCSRAGQLSTKETANLKIIVVSASSGDDQNDDERHIKIRPLDLKTGKQLPGYPKQVQVAKEDSGILMGAAVLDAQKKFVESSKNKKVYYNEVSPHELDCIIQKGYRGDWKFIGIPSTPRPVFLSKWGSTLKIRETIKSGWYLVSLYKTEDGRNDRFQIKFDTEGFAWVSLKGQPQKPAAKAASYMDWDEIEVSRSGKMTSIFKATSAAPPVPPSCAEESAGSKSNPVKVSSCHSLSESFQQTCLTGLVAAMVSRFSPDAPKVKEEQTNVKEEQKEVKQDESGSEPTAKVDPCDELKEKLKKLVEDVQSKISSENCPLKNPMILERIDELITKSKKILEQENDPKMTDRAWKRAFQNLENYAEKLKVQE